MKIQILKNNDELRSRGEWKYRFKHDNCNVGHMHFDQLGLDWIIIQ